MRYRPFCAGDPVPAAAGRLHLRARGSRRPVVDAVIRAALPAAYNPYRDGVQIVVRDPVSPETAVLDLTRGSAVPGGAPGSGCDPRDGWRPGGAVYRYRNFSDALPPACVSGSAGGLARMRIDRGRNRIAFRTRHAMTLPGGPLAATVAFGAGGDAVIGGRCVSADATCTDTGRALRCR